MTHTIKKGKHRGWPIHFGLWFNKTRIRKIVCFDFTCRYTLNNGDQEDVNKLFGIGYFWFHQNNSALFGWRWSPEDKRIIVYAYMHIKGKRSFYPLAKLEVGKNYILELTISNGSYKFSVTSADNMYQMAWAVYDTGHRKKWAYPLGVFFGGTQSAPRTMTINLKNSDHAK